MDQIKEALIKRKLPEQVMKNDILKGTLKSLQFVGIIVTEVESNIHYFKGIFCLSYFMLFGAGQMMVNSDNIFALTVYATFGLHLLSISLRAIDFYVKQPKFYVILREINEDLEKMKSGNDKERKIIEKTTSYAKIVEFTVLKIGRLAAALMAFVHLVVAKFNPLKMMKMTMNPPFLQVQWPIPSSDVWLFMLNSYNWVALMMCVSIISSWQYFMSSLPLFAVLNFKVLNHRLRNVKDYIVGKTREERCRQANAFLIQCVERHMYIKNYLDELQTLSGKFLFLDFIIYSIQLCFMLFQITTASDPNKLIFTVAYVCPLTMFLFLYYYHGNEVIVQSDLISTAIYESNWYDYDLKFKKTVILIMTNTYEPTKLYAGIIELSLVNFIAIFKTAYSYFTLLNAVSN